MRLRKLDSEGKGIGFVVSPRATNEEIFMIKEIAAVQEGVALDLRPLPYGQGAEHVQPHGHLP